MSDESSAESGRGIHRRRFLTVGVAATAALAGCSAPFSRGDSSQGDLSREELIVSLTRRKGIEAIDSVYDPPAVFDLQYQSRADSLEDARAELFAVSQAFAVFQDTYEHEFLAVLPVNGPIFRATVPGSAARQYRDGEMPTAEYASKVYDSIVIANRSEQ